MYQQSNPPLPPAQTLPTMYDLPSEEIGDAGLPDQYHFWQGELLGETFSPPNYPEDQTFYACDLNLYYDVRHTNWYKSPDWFGAVGIDRLYQQRESRLSYVTWQEGVNPFVIVELLSPSTENEDLGRTVRKIGQPPTKWQVYEKILRIPYYVVFDGTTNKLQVFQITGNTYQKISLSESQIWLPEINLGLGLWEGTYKGLTRQWLRWYDQNSHWISTPTEKEQKRADEAQQRASQAQQRTSQVELENQRLRELLKQSGMVIPDDLS